MGLFDLLIVECALPDAGAAAVKEWQTKDLPDPYLHTYKITAEGRLLSERIGYDDKPDPEASRDTLESFIECRAPVHDAWDDMNYHGILTFYGDADSGEGPGEDHDVETEWFEYRAKFTDGKLVAIERVERNWGSANPK